MPRRPHDRSTTRRSSRLLWRHDYERFRERLIKARKAAGLTQREAAAALDRSNSYVAKSENGERRVDVIELARFAKLYRRPLHYFLPPD